MAVAEPGSAISQVFVPSSVISDGFGASTHLALSLPDPSIGFAAGVPGSVMTAPRRGPPGTR
jgi:hypothetical protein